MPKSDPKAFGCQRAGSVQAKLWLGGDWSLQSFPAPWQPSGLSQPCPGAAALHPPGRVSGGAGSSRGLVQGARRGSPSLVPSTPRPPKGVVGAGRRSEQQPGSGGCSHREPLSLPALPCPRWRAPSQQLQSLLQAPSASFALLGEGFLPRASSSFLGCSVNEKLSVGLPCLSVRHGSQFCVSFLKNALIC